LISLGFDPAKVEMKGFSGADIYTAIGVRGQPYDLFVSIGWCSDFPDAAGDFRGLLTAANVHTYDQKLAAVMRLPANKRAKALGKLDIQIMKTVAPLAPMGYYNNRFFLSNRVDRRSLVYSSAYQGWSIPASTLGSWRSSPST
jgi:hypothetical protein